MSLLDNADCVVSLSVLSCFRAGFYDCLTARADALFELTDALLCADGPVKSLVELTLTAEHPRGHGALYDGLNCGRIEADRLRAELAGLPLPRADDGRIVLAVDVSPRLRSDTPTSADRLFCHVYGRAKSVSQFIPGWLYSFGAVLESGRTSWTAILDAVRLGPEDDATAVTAGQLRGVVQRLIAAGHWCEGDPNILVVMDAGYDVTRLAFVLADLPVEVLGRIRSGRVLRLPKPPRLLGTDGRPPKHGPEFALAKSATWPERTYHDHRNDPLRHRDGPKLGPAPPAAYPPHLLARPRRRTTRHRRHVAPPAGRPPARRPQPRPGVAVVLGHRRHRRRR